MHIDLHSEIKYLHNKIAARKEDYEQGLKNDLEFATLREIFVEIKEMEAKIQRLYDQSEGHKSNPPGTAISNIG
jgi:hypothetical protein